MGMCATVAQQVIPFAAALAPPARRGRTVGTVMAGVLCGILLSRTLAGVVGTHLGWRAMFWLAVPLGARGCRADGGAAAAPPSAPHHGLRRRAAPLLPGCGARSLRCGGRRRCRRCCSPRSPRSGPCWPCTCRSRAFHLGADVAGLFGVVGAVGVLAAPLAGRIADRRGPRAGDRRRCAVLTLLSWLLFGLWGAVPGPGTGRGRAGLRRARARWCPTNMWCSPCSRTRATA